MVCLGSRTHNASIGSEACSARGTPQAVFTFQQEIYQFVTAVVVSAAGQSRIEEHDS